MSEWRKIGECGVDSGTIMIVDPCYVLPDHENDKPLYTYDQFLEAHFKHLKQNPGESDKDFISRKNEACLKPLAFADGVISSTYWGDGTYPVYGLYEEKTGRGTPQALIIDFTGSECEGCGERVSEIQELRQCENDGECCGMCGDPSCDGEHCNNCEEKSDDCTCNEGEEDDED